MKDNIERASKEIISLVFDKTIPQFLSRNKEKRQDYINILLPGIKQLVEDCVNECVEESIDDGYYSSSYNCGC